ncbi:MAG: hypothetical protein H7A46_04405 [Verrucomicrobiales bacterium]|nr:hypothetical protein [Verrucomicrobiales bacterium]
MATNLSIAPSAPPAPVGVTPTPTNSLAMEPLRDIKPPVDIPDWSWLGWVLAAMVLAVAATWWLRRRRKPAAVVEVSPEELIPPHVRARARLEEALQLIGEPKPFCTAVSDALRLYLEEQFELHAPERTTEEFLDEVQASPRLDESQKTLLGDFLTRCDLVKFAKHEPAEPELRELHGVALRLVIETERARSLAGEPPAQPEAALAEPTPPPGPEMTP